MNHNAPISEQYGKLTFLREGTPRVYASGTRSTGVFRCECGTEKELLMSHVRRGKTVSCGCYHAEKMAVLLTTHGNTGSNEYTIWSNMIQRCHNPLNLSYERYGARGIHVCEEWKTSFAAFLQHIGRRPTKRHTLDRIDNELGYAPGNVRWATIKEQNNNKRSCIRVEYDGVSMSLADYCRVVGLSYNTVQYRRNVLGWSLPQAIGVKDGQ